MKFGGASQFGGSSQFGGGDPRGVQYFRGLKGLEPPGVYEDDDETLHRQLLRIWGDAIGSHGQVLIDRTRLEVFPHLAEEEIPTWEALFKIVPPSTATLAERREALLARYRGNSGSTLAELRAMLADLINSSTAFRDLFDDENISNRWTKVMGNGAMGEATLLLTLLVSSTVHGDWTELVAEAPHVLYRLHDRDDDFYVEMLVDSFGGADEIAGGIVLHEADDKAWLWGLYRDSGSTLYLQADRIQDGTLTRGEVQVAAPSLPCWIKVSRVAGVLSFEHGASLSSMTVDGTSATTIRPRHVGAYCRNEDSSYNAASVVIDEFQLRHGAKANNVEIIEMPLDSVPSGTPESKMFAFVHREPTDAGNYNLTEAQRIVDRVKQAHSLILVGESDCFLCDDPYSLCDRDILGA